LKLYVGCCGFPVARERYFRTFTLVELQNTFYDLPTEDEAQRLRNSIPSNAIVTMKAWQVITHPCTSPTWKRMKRKPSGDLQRYGYLKPTKENLEAWESVVRIAKILDAKAIVLQTPPSFGYSEENLRNVLEFFSTIERTILVCWEPRGTWRNHREAIAKVVELGIVHVTDLLKEDPVLGSNKVLYTRLHGLGPGEVNYRYRYTDEDLKKLCAKIKNYLGTVDVAYVLFNNIYMFNDAQRFREIVSSDPEISKNVEIH